MLQRRAQRRTDSSIIDGQVKVLFWWVTVRRFVYMSDALEWLGYGEED